jgi:RNA polymerase sigma-70 factor (ECF subfamily)
MVDEAGLVARAQEGDEEALAEIVESHQRTVYNVALRMCGNPQDAEETLQETFLSAIKALPSFEGRSQLSTWLYRIASNACLMQRRNAANAPDLAPLDHENDEGFEEPRYFVDWSVRPDDVLLDNELREAMEKAIEALPDSLRIVFIWRELEGLSTAETAEVLDITEGAVKVRLHRARLKLREILSEGYFAASTVEPGDDSDATEDGTATTRTGENGHG